MTSGGDALWLRVVEVHYVDLELMICRWKKICLIQSFQTWEPLSSPTMSAPFPLSKQSDEHGVFPCRHLFRDVPHDLRDSGGKYLPSRPCMPVISRSKEKITKSAERDVFSRCLSPVSVHSTKVFERGRWDSHSSSLSATSKSVIQKWAFQVFGALTQLSTGFLLSGLFS